MSFPGDDRNKEKENKPRWKISVDVSEKLPGSTLEEEKKKKKKQKQRISCVLLDSK